jgi:hypothetical protein
MSLKEVRAALHRIGLGENPSVRVLTSKMGHQAVRGLSCSPAPLGGRHHEWRPEDVAAYCSACSWDEVALVLARDGSSPYSYGGTRTSESLAALRTRFERAMTGTPLDLADACDLLRELPASTGGALELEHLVCGPKARERFRTRLANELLEWLGAEALKDDAWSLVETACELMAVGHAKHKDALLALKDDLVADAARQGVVLVDLEKVRTAGWSTFKEEVHAEVFAQHGRLAALPSGVARWLAKDGGLKASEMAVLTDASEELLEAVRVLHDPSGDGKCSTLAGALEVARAL